MSEQDYEQLMLFPADFLANHSLLQENNMERMTKDTCGLKCCALSAKSNHALLLQKTFLDLFEMHLTTYLKVLKSRNTKRGHTLSRLVPLGHHSQVKESLLWPRPTTGAPLCGGTHNFKQMERLQEAGIITEEERKNLTQGNGGKSNPALMEWLMGFPIGWTDLNA